MSKRKAKAERKEGKVEVVDQVGAWSLLRLTNPARVTTEQLAAAVGDETSHPAPYLNGGVRFKKGLKTAEYLHYFSGDDPRAGVDLPVNREAGVILRHLDAGGGLDDDALRWITAPPYGRPSNVH